MNASLLEQYYKNFQTNPSLCNWADIFSLSTWDKIGFCRFQANFNIHEITITQGLIYEFWLLATSRKFPVQIYQAIAEEVNGNDIEIAIQTRNGYLLFPCQAKIVNKTWRYPRISHKVGSKKQIDLLLEYGRKTRGIPIYFFYNFGSDPTSNDAIEKMHSLKIERLGCSIFPAEFIKHNFYRPGSNRWSIPDFYKIHHLLAIPFSNLFQLINSRSIPGFNLDGFSSGARFYSEEELISEDIWKDIAPPAAIGRIDTFRSNTDEIAPADSKDPTFAPAFRILFPIERRTTTLYRIS
jgi:hypothetical protein